MNLKNNEDLRYEADQDEQRWKLRTLTGTWTKMENKDATKMNKEEAMNKGDVVDEEDEAK